jgi:hypothetical protein
LPLDPRDPDIVRAKQRHATGRTTRSEPGSETRLR